MELSKRTIGVLKLFASINENLVFKAGNKQRTIATDEGVFAEAEIDESIPSEFPICNLSTFLRNFDSAEKMKFEVTDRAVLMKVDDSSLRWLLGAKALIKSPPDKDMNLSNAIVTFKVTKEQLARVSTFAEINSLSHIVVGSDGEKLYLAAKDPKNDDAATARVNVCDAPDAAAVWEELLSFERFSKLHKMDCEVKVIPKSFVAFIGDRLSFMIAVER